MGLFDRLYYGKAGKRDYSEMDMPKTRVSLFFLVLKDHFLDLVKVNLLQLVFWLPFLVWTYINIVAIQSIDAQTLLSAENGESLLMSEMMSFLFMWLIGVIPCVAITGPSSAGAAYIMRNWARDQHAFLFSDFKDAFKSNWKQALLVSVVSALVPVLGYAAMVYYGGMSSSNIVMIAPMIFVLSAILMWALMLVLLYPLMVGYELKSVHLVKNAFLMAAASLPKMILARIITLIPIIIFAFGLLNGSMTIVMVISMYYILFGFAFSRLIYASFANGVFDHFLNPKIEGAQVRQGLRPHMEEDELFTDDDDDDDEF